MQSSRAKLLKEIRRNLAFYCLMAAHSYDLAHIYGACAKTTSLEEAKNISNLCNLFINDPYKKTSVIDFMKSPEDKANKAISHYKNYQKSIELMPSKKRLIESFSRWYAHTGWESAFIKCNIRYIEATGCMVLKREQGEISEREYLNFLNSLSELKDPWFSFHPKEVRWAFAKALSKCGEIENKIKCRTTYHY